MFKTKEEVAEYFAGDTIECLECGKTMKMLVNHLRRAHKMSVEAYKIKHGLPFSLGLVADQTREKMATALTRRIASGDPTLMPIEKVAHIGQQKKNRYQPYTIKDMAERFSRYNTGRSATREDMEKFVAFIEQQKAPAWRVRKKENSLGIITYGTFMRHKAQHADLADRYDAIISTRPQVQLKHHGRRGEIREKVLSLRKQGMYLDDIATKTGIPKTTVGRIVNGKGFWGEKRCQ